MKYLHINHQASIKLVILIITAVIVPFIALPVSAQQPTDNSVMMQKLLEFHTKLAKQGNPESIAKLGTMYENGEGVHKDRNKAIKLYRLAADKGYRPAQQLLANILANKSNVSKRAYAPEILKVPTPKINTATDDAKQQKQIELQIKLEREKAAAAREELERLRQARIKEQEKQQHLLNEVEKVQQAQEELARERARAEAARRELEQLRKQQEEHLREQQELAKKQQQEKLKEEQEIQKQQSDTADNSTFSSDPCNTPAARFMSTCN